ncbi:MAG: transporter substrate-binding domain-containing protein [Acetobacteraceae bacterium]|jgi:ABC-type amino acid transport substrate-binding protein
MRHMAHRLARYSLVAGIALFAAPRVNAATIGVPENLGPWGLSPSLPADQRGVYVNLAEAIAAHTKVPIEIKFVPYGRMLQQVKSGELDYAFGVVGPATVDAGQFTAIVGKVPMVAVARKGLALKTLNDLHGFTEVGYLRGGSCGAAVDSDAAIKRVSQDSYESAIRKMAAGRLDGWCSVKAGFTYTLGTLKMESEMGDQLDYGEVKIGFQVSNAKADSAEAHELTAVVDKLVTDGAAGQIFTRYLGSAYAP